MQVENIDKNIFFLTFLRACNAYRAISKFDKGLLLEIHESVLHDEMDCLFKNKHT